MANRSPHKSGLPWADTIPYFKTGQSSPDTWIQKAKEELSKAGAKDVCEAMLSTPDRTTIGLAFRLNGETFRVVFPVLPRYYEGEDRAARIQAATLMYHDIKARCVSARVFGLRAAFIGNLLVDGTTLGEMSSQAIAEHASALRLAEPVQRIAGPKS